MKQRPTQQEWLELPTEQRNILVLRFFINKSGGMQVRDSRVVSDGVADQDLENGINIGKMIEYLGEPEWKKYIDVKLEDLADTLWAACVAKEFGAPGPFEVKEEVKKEKPLKVTKKKGGKDANTPSLTLSEPEDDIDPEIKNFGDEDSEIKV